MSTKRLSPKEIKRDIRQDELRHLLSETALQAQSHSQLVIAILVGVFVLALGAAGVYGFLESRENKANRELADAIELYDAPVVAEGAKPTDPNEPSFASEAERKAAAKQAFEKLESGFGSSVAGDIARLYLAEMAIAEGDATSARKTWEDFLDEHEGHVLATSVRINLIRLDRNEGKAEQVEAQLRKELDDPDKKLPEDAILFELAQTLDTLGRRDEAEELYQRLIEEYPRSAYSAEANQRVSTPG